MEKITIEEIKIKKTNVEKEILKLVEDFEEQTGMIVEFIRIETIPVFGIQRTIQSIKLEVVL